MNIKKQSIKKQVYDAIVSFGRDGCLQHQVLEKFPGKPYPSVTARFSELLADGYIIRGPDKRMTPSGEMAVVMRASKFSDDAIRHGLVKEMVN